MCSIIQETARLFFKRKSMLHHVKYKLIILIFSVVVSKHIKNLIENVEKFDLEIIGNNRDLNFLSTESIYNNFSVIIKKKTFNNKIIAYAFFYQTPVRDTFTYVLISNLFKSTIFYAN